MKEKSQVEDIDRSIYDFKDDEKDAYRIKVRLFYKKRNFSIKNLKYGYQKRQKEAAASRFFNR